MGMAVHRRKLDEKTSCILHISSWCADRSIDEGSQVQGKGVPAAAA